MLCFCTRSTGKIPLPLRYLTEFSVQTTPIMNGTFRRAFSDTLWTSYSFCGIILAIVTGCLSAAL